MPSKDADAFLEALVKVMLEARQRQKISQESWATASGIDRASISRLERLERIPSILALYDLAKALGSPLHVFVEKAHKSVADTKKTSK